MKIYWATKLRGFLKHVSTSLNDIEFIHNNYYEISTVSATIKSKLIRSKFFDLFGTFQVIKVNDKDCDYYASYNRFLKCDKPYFIYLENPTALYHYALGRVKSFAGKRRFKKCLNDPNLKYIVCMSEACRSTFEKINMELPENLKMRTIYPLIPKNNQINETIIREKCFSETLKCLYCVQGKSFYTKGGRDILEAVSKLQDQGANIHLTVITNFSALSQDTIELIENHKNITLYDFSFTYEQMEKIYAQNALLLMPSSADSFSLTVLESLKGGCAVLGSKLYAIPEMVEDNSNGFLIDPLYWTFTSDKMPNPFAWGYEKKVKLSSKRSQKYVDDIESAIKRLYEDRDLLYSFSKKSLEIANTKFDQSIICSQWQEVWHDMEGAK